MRRNKLVMIFIRLLVAAIVLVAIGRLMSSVTATPELGIKGGKLAKCPETPNCVSSQADPGSGHYVEGFQLPQSIELTPEQFRQLVEAIDAMAGSRLIEQSDSYARFKFQSLVFGFVDDLEISGVTGSRTIDVRSASRLGYSDLGANRRRVERIRKRFAEQ